MTNEEILKDINDEDALRALRTAADEKLQKVKEAKRVAELKLVADDYLDKYMISYGHTWVFDNGKMQVNLNDMTIVHITSIDFKGRNFLRCKANVIKIEYNNENEWLTAGLNCSDFGQVNIRCYSTPSFDIDDTKKFTVISKKDVDKLISDAYEASKHALTSWDKA